eukprot:UN06999
MGNIATSIYETVSTMTTTGYGDVPAATMMYASEQQERNNINEQQQRVQSAQGRMDELRIEELIQQAGQFSENDEELRQPTLRTGGIEDRPTYTSGTVETEEEEEDPDYMDTEVVTDFVIPEINDNDGGVQKGSEQSSEETVSFRINSMTKGSLKKE